jgi:hypothetical protein
MNDFIILLSLYKSKRAACTKMDRVKEAISVSVNNEIDDF